MSEASQILVPNGKTPLRVSGGRLFMRVMFSRWPVTIGSVIVVLLIVAAIFSPLLAPFDPDKLNLRESLQQPSSQHLLGTDELGRDLLSRLIYGSRIAVFVGIVAVSLSAIVGMFLGLLAGYFGGWVETIIMRFIDTLMALPPLVLMLAVAVVLGGGLLNVLVAIALGLMPTHCRLMCGQVLAAKENDYVMAANVLGANSFRIMLRHLLPNVFPPILVILTLDLGFAILLEASLSYLGIGINPPTATWGAMINLGQRYLMTNPLLSIAPCLCLALVVIAFNNVGDGLRDALDPRLRGVLM